jgi:hypothetical protein
MYGETKQTYERNIERGGSTANYVWIEPQVYCRTCLKRIRRTTEDIGKEKK